MNYEYESLKDSFLRAKFGSFLLVPLKYEEQNLNKKWLEDNGEKTLFETMDINESVKQTINGKNAANVTDWYKFPCHLLERAIAGEGSGPLCLYACEKDTAGKPKTEDSFVFESLSLYIFHTQIAFLCLGIRYSNMGLLDRICNPGYVDSRARYVYERKDGFEKTFSLDEELEKFCRNAGLECFFKSGSSLFLEGYAYNIALVPERFKELETMRQATFNLHLMVDLAEPAEDASEADIAYVYAVKDQAKGSYRWGCCVTSQTISYIVADETMNLQNEMKEQEENGVPVVLLALYQKYTCLRFRELLSDMEKKHMKSLKKLRRQMLEFQVYGTIAPANLSRWHNVKQIYQYVMENNAVDELVEEINAVVGIVSEHQTEIESARSNAVMGLISMFGAVSIVDSVISIVPALVYGEPLEWMAAGGSVLVMATLIGLVMWIRRRE